MVVVLDFLKGSIKSFLKQDLSDLTRLGNSRTLKKTFYLFICFQSDNVQWLWIRLNKIYINVRKEKKLRLRKVLILCT